MYYLIYKITNIDSGKFYIGKHMTEDKNDSYIGSGKYLKFAQQCHGIDKFKKEILFECSSEEEMNRKEAEIVTLDFLEREDTYNIMPGGSGGWTYINQKKLNKGAQYSNDHHMNNKVNQCYIAGEKCKSDPEYAKWFSQRVKEGQQKVREEHPEKFKPQNGKNNPMYGRRKLTNPNTGVSKFVKHEEIEKYLQLGFEFAHRSYK